MNQDVKIFSDMKLSNLLQQIYLNQKSKSYKITQLIDQLKGMVNTVQDAILLVPSIANYLTIDVKNDQILVKLVSNITKIMQNSLKEKLLTTKPGQLNIITDAQFQQLIQLTQKQKNKLLKQQKQLLNQIDQTGLI